MYFWITVSLILCVVLLAGRMSMQWLAHHCSPHSDTTVSVMTPASRLLHAPARWLPLGLALVAITLATAFTLRGALPTNTVTLPIEVYPADGMSEHVESVTLYVSDASGIDSLYVQAHQPFYIIGGWEHGVADDGFDPEQAAAIRINGGDWVPVRDESVNCAWPERAYDCVAGPYHTIRFTIPATDTQPGANTIDFKFNGTEGARSGYRVIGLGLMTGADPSVQDFDPMQHGAHDGTTFQEERLQHLGPASRLR